MLAVVVTSGLLASVQMVVGFDTLVRWARYGNLFAYDEATQTLSLQ